MNKFQWSMSDLDSVPKNGAKVFSTFSCGGGSTMGYKLAGFDVIGANDIDPKMRDHYVDNHHPDHFFLCPVRDLITMDLPDEVMGVDVLDGSPPCSAFSISGKRARTWGKKVHFKEGQAAQVLDDLFFDFIDVAAHIKPKIIIAENVKGMLAGNARGYLRMVTKRLDQIGYRHQIFLCNAADFGVPQSRERVFVVAIRKDIDAAPLSIKPTHSPVSCSEAFDDMEFHSTDEKKTLRHVREQAWRSTPPGGTFNTHFKNKFCKDEMWNHVRMHPSHPSATVVAQGRATLYHWKEPRNLVLEEVAILSSFPHDYKFTSPHVGHWMMGMSVPPGLMRGVSKAVADQWLPAIGKNISR